MPKFRKKPVEIEAVQWKGDNLREVHDFMGINSDRNLNIDYADLEKMYRKNGLPIETMEGTLDAQVNDWIIKGVNGEFYPCKPDIFQKTYEPVTDN